VSEEEKISDPELLRKAFQTYVDVLEENRKEQKKRKGIERAVELQDEIREKIDSSDLIAALRNWRDKRK
jgi:hypothetical protein